MNLPKFLIFRFAPGAAGNFVSSMLQCSPEVAHMSSEEQSNKPNNNWIQYFKKVFHNDLANWTHKEPSSVYSWGTKNIFSQKFNRGNKLSVKQFERLENQHCTDAYHDAKQKKLYIPIFWHKNHMPVYFANSITVTIDIDTKFAGRWFNRARYKKHYNAKYNHSGITVDIMENRPNYQVAGFTNPSAKQFSTLYQFVREEIINDVFRQNFTNLQNVTSWNIPNVHLNLSHILTDKFANQYHRICGFYNLTPIRNTIEVIQLQEHWLNCHKKPFDNITVT
jgi:hypothetical protein